MLGLFGLAIVVATLARWFQLIQKVAIPRNRTPYMVAYLAGGSIGLVGAFQGGLVGGIAGGIAAFLGFLFPALRLQSGQQPNEPSVALGDPMLAFSAPDETGADFDLSSLTGKPYLLKFFRGHW
jgi:hypothetical protein